MEAECSPNRALQGFLQISDSGTNSHQMANLKIEIKLFLELTLAGHFRFLDFVNDLRPD
jgi:hypothetical protein